LSNKDGTEIMTVKTFLPNNWDKCFFWAFYSSKNSEKKRKNPLWFTQKYKAAQLFTTLIILINVSWAEWFLKDHVTLKTGVMIMKYQLCISQRKKLQF